MIILIYITKHMHNTGSILVLLLVRYYLRSKVFVFVVTTIVIINLLILRLILSLLS